MYRASIAIALPAIGKQVPLQPLDGSNLVRQKRLAGHTELEDVSTPKHNIRETEMNIHIFLASLGNMTQRDLPLTPVRMTGDEHGPATL